MKHLRDQLLSSVSDSTLSFQITRILITEYAKKNKEKLERMNEKRISR